MRRGSARRPRRRRSAPPGTPLPTRCCCCSSAPVPKRCGATRRPPPPPPLPQTRRRRGRDVTQLSHESREAVRRGPHSYFFVVFIFYLVILFRCCFLLTRPLPILLCTIKRAERNYLDDLLKGFSLVKFGGM